VHAFEISLGIGNHGRSTGSEPGGHSKVMMDDNKRVPRIAGQVLVEVLSMPPADAEIRSISTGTHLYDIY